ncbi:helix-turn-helix domain-containing protein [Paenarthrobacter sp. PH39-S1]|uniref:winged helix-turn-helix domain-containing protein n=1 Tax=Paenarthrobacter sp. PH39-S1 TaxID=3046204 RepID=UPI0024BA91E0|nr:helix-turn-helix domain-containing protein [Paenarthrobacter sp. PH39-S1]MDJ0356515.1 helix-turn-helix domain-containing protein [Paenarthrobacter sp. PH39-S1]
MAYTHKIVDDLDTLRAIANPLRMKLLGALREDGPATASELGRRFGESSGSTSYHLRQLERFGFVGDCDDQPSRRERRWKALHDLTEVRSENFAGDEAGRQLMQSTVGYAVEYFMGNADEYLHRELSTRWRSTLGVSDYLLKLTSTDTDELLSGIGDLIESYRERESTAGDAMSVALHVAALPRKQP